MKVAVKAWAREKGRARRKMEGNGTRCYTEENMCGEQSTSNENSERGKI